MGSNEGRAWVSMGGVDHVEMSEGFFGLTPRFLSFLQFQSTKPLPYFFLMVFLHVKKRKFVCLDFKTDEY